MASHTSATAHKEAPHATESTQNNISDAIRRRAQSIINDKSIDAQTRTIIRYGLETDDPWLPELVRRVDAGETILDSLGLVFTRESESELREEKIARLADRICRSNDEPETRAAALSVLMSTIENSAHPKALANSLKHLAFNRCAEANLYGMVDAQLAMIETELFESIRLRA